MSTTHEHMIHGIKMKPGYKIDSINGRVTVMGYIYI